MWRHDEEANMTGPISDHERGGESRSTPPGMPRWVKISALVVVVVVLVLVVIMALAGGEHGPDLHTGASDHTGILSSTAFGLL